MACFARLSLSAPVALPLSLPLPLLYHEKFYRSSIFVLCRSILRHMFVIQDRLEHGDGLRHLLGTQLLSQNACTELVLAQGVAAAALGNIGEHQLPVCPPRHSGSLSE
jgi:hypothetical protein